MFTANAIGTSTSAGAGTAFRAFFTPSPTPLLSFSRPHLSHTFFYPSPSSLPSLLSSSSSSPATFSFFGRVPPFSSSRSFHRLSRPRSVLAHRSRFCLQSRPADPRRHYASSSSPPSSSSSTASSPRQPSGPASAQPGSRSDPTAQFRARMRHKNITTMNYALSVLIGTVALAYGSVPLYKMICQTTGWGGQPIRSPTHGGGGGDYDSSAFSSFPLPSFLSFLSPQSAASQDAASGSTAESDEQVLRRLAPATDQPRIRITFRSSVSSILPWKFVPQQREVFVHPGETALAFYTATNNSPLNEDIIGVATYSVSPAQAAPYFAKIQCFCFEEQRLMAGETVDMPVFFYVDKAIAFDRNCRNVKEITLNYTFFKAKYDRDGHLNPVPMPTFGSSLGLGGTKQQPKPEPATEPAPSSATSPAASNP